VFLGVLYIYFFSLKHNSLAISINGIFIITQLAGYLPINVGPRLCNALKGNVLRRPGFSHNCGNVHVNDVIH
jgi:hypothetical protein